MRGQGQIDAMMRLLNGSTAANSAASSQNLPGSGVELTDAADACRKSFSICVTEAVPTELEVPPLISA